MPSDQFAEFTFMPHDMLHLAISRKLRKRAASYISSYEKRIIEPRLNNYTRKMNSDKFIHLTLPNSLHAKYNNNFMLPDL